MASLTRERPGGGQGISDHVGREAVRYANIRLQRDHRREIERGGIGAGRQSGDDRVGRRPRVFEWLCVADGRGAEPVESGVLDVRVVERIGRGGFCGLAPWAIGSDTRGSIICPTSWCGLSGMRPSFGRVSRYGAMAIAWTMDKLGPMARSADDCGLILAVIAGLDPKDHDSGFAGAFGFCISCAEGKPRKPLRVGRLTNVFGHLRSADWTAVNEALKGMEKNGATLRMSRCRTGRLRRPPSLLF